MPVIKVKGSKIELDDEGFLINLNDWNEEVACAIADREGVSKTCPLTKERMELIKFMREYYKKFNAFPLPSIICRNLHQPSKCVVERFLEPVKAWKIAGLPKPPAELIYRIGSECG
ncbi:MAG: TusE/DsrC/DsvC family sulfur relay protein [Thermodesulfovibrionales bacterium]